MAPNGHFNVGVACTQTGYRISGCQFLKIIIGPNVVYGPSCCKQRIAHAREEASEV